MSARDELDFRDLTDRDRAFMLGWLVERAPVAIVAEAIDAARRDRRAYPLTGAAGSAAASEIGLLKARLAL